MTDPWNIEGPLSDQGLRALYDAGDPNRYLVAARDYRALTIADAAARRGRDAVRLALGAAAMTTVDRPIRAARETLADDARHALALTMRGPIMLGALLDAAAGWRVEPETGLVYRRYDADGTETPDGRYRRAVRVDMGRYYWGVADMTLSDEQGYVAHGATDDPAEALRLALAEPLENAPAGTPPET
ncbi:hypothetical protein [Frankia gtarii]|uniref:hypothetical protein n=1 Tax=Frankia gtarii TaxID=2950102 RepID=UPI0021C0EB1A|nr:hypothetical protein [Frankia gtarii]